MGWRLCSWSPVRFCGRWRIWAWLEEDFHSFNAVTALFFSLSLSCSLKARGKEIRGYAFHGFVVALTPV
jgi:hypothetical protein